MTSFLHCLLFKFSVCSGKHTVVEGIQEKHPFSVIVDHRPTRPEDFLNESRVTFLQTKTCTQPDNPVNSMPCVCLCVSGRTCSSSHTHISGCGHKHSLYPSVCKLVFYCAAEKTTRTQCLDKSAFIHNTKLLALTNGGTNNSPFITAIKQRNLKCLGSQIYDRVIFLNCF